jgi:hypothetical protein
MSTEFNFLVIDANQLVEKQQTLVRELVTQRLGVEQFRRPDRFVPAAVKEFSKRQRREAVIE